MFQVVMLSRGHLERGETTGQIHGETRLSSKSATTGGVTAATVMSGACGGLQGAPWCWTGPRCRAGEEFVNLDAAKIHKCTVQVGFPARDSIIKERELHANTLHHELYNIR